MENTNKTFSNFVDLHWGDSLTLGLYFLVVVCVGIWAIIRSRKSSAQDYFLASRSMTFFPIGASIFASNIGAPLFVGLSGSAAASGIGGMIFEWHAIPFILTLGWIFIPVFVACGVYTIPEYMEKRYGGKRLRLYLSLLSIVLYIITKISVEMYAGALFIKMLFGWNLYVSCILILAFSALFTMIGGLTVVLITDTLQTIVFIAGAFVLMGISLNKVGGYNALKSKYMDAVPNTVLLSNQTNGCGYPRSDSFSLLRDPINSDYPWPGTLIFNIPGDIWFWCTDQVMVQRSLSAKNLSHAKGGSIVAGYLKILPFFMFVLPGMAARVLFPDEVACIDPKICENVCGNPYGCSNIAYPLLVMRILMPGLRGIMFAAMLAAVMSTLTSVFNSASSLFTMDLWTRFRTNASSLELLIVGRVIIVVLAVCTIIWIPIMQSGQASELWQYWQALMSAVGPPWALVFLMGFFWQRTTEPAAFWGMLAGQMLGLARLVMLFAYKTPECDAEDDRPAFLKIHFLYIAAMETALSAFVMVTLSFFTKPRTKEELHCVTWWTRRAKTVSDDRESNPVQMNIEDVQFEDNSSWRQKIFILCGMSTNKNESQQSDKVVDLKENPVWRDILNINAIILLVLVSFIIGFFH